MCSIGGWISTTPINKYSAMNLARALLFYGRGRGTQSGGIYYNGRLLKKAMDPQDLIDLPDFDNLFESETGPAGRICLTHTRQPTCGGRGDAQAQPFEHGDAVTIHNGWYFDTADIKSQFNIKKPSGVDSELACRIVSSYGPQKLPDFISKSSGASAIACKWKDDLYLMRSGNPIVYAHIPLVGKNIITLFASTEEQLAFAARYVFLLGEDNLTVKTLKEGILYRMNPGQAERLTTTPVEHDLSGYTTFSHGGWPGGKHGGYHDDYWKRWEDGETTEELEATLNSDLICKTWLDSHEYEMFLIAEDPDEVETWVSLAFERKAMYVEACETDGEPTNDTK